MKLDREILDRDPILAEVVRRLLAAYQPEALYLFRSKARGDEGPDSDYDLLLVVRTMPQLSAATAVSV